MIAGIDPSEPFWDRVYVPLLGDRETGCWVWLGAVQTAGYGLSYVADGRRQRRAMAHRRAYELLVGPIPEGLVLDHLCVNPWCVNPAHLEPVTAEENRRRQNERKHSCRGGHSLSDGNLYTHAGKRYCRKCRAATQRRYAERLSC